MNTKQYGEGMTLHFKGKRTLIVPTRYKEAWDTLFAGKDHVRIMHMLHTFLPDEYEILVIPKSKPDQPNQLNVVQQEIDFTESRYQ